MLGEKFYASLLLVALVTIQAEGQTNATGVASADWVGRSWQTKDGLPQNTVNALVQAKDGYLWVGTSGGLARFDGVRFRTFGLQDGLRSVQIFRLCEDSHGVLWVGTIGGGLSCWENGKFKTFGKAEGFAAAAVHALAADPDGSLWIGTESGLVRRQNGVFTSMGAESGLPAGQVRALALDAKGVLWVSSGGVYFGQKGKFTRAKSDGSAPGGVYSLMEDRDGAIWAGAGGGSLWEGRERNWKRYDTTNGLPRSELQSMAQGREGTVWVGTRDFGLYFSKEGRFHKLTDANLSAGSILALLVDREGNVWAGLAGGGGLHRLSRRILQNWGQAEGLRDPIVSSVAEDRAGALWVTTQNDGLWRFDQHRLSKLNDAGGAKNYSHAYSTVAADDGSIWTAGEQFLHRFRSGQATQTFLKPPIRGEAIRALCAAGSNLWLGTYYSTLLRFDGNEVRVVATNGSFGGGITSLVCEGPETLWIGTSAGLYRWERGAVRSWTTSDGLLTANIGALHRDANGTLWIGTLGGGLARLKNGRITNITMRQGLADDVISQIVADDPGQLWLGCNRGIMRLERRELEDLADGKSAVVHPIVLGENEGMVKEQCTGGHSPTAMKTRDGRLLFPTVGGLVEVDPRRVHTRTAPPQVIIEELTLDGHPLPLREGTLSLPPGSRELEIHYTAFNYAEPEHLRFRHRLANRNEEWVEAGKARSIRYSLHRPGDYAFQVSAANEDGRWSEIGTTLAFTMQAFYWQTVWFRVVGALLFMGCGGGAVWGLVRARLRRAMEQARLTGKLRESEQWLNLSADSAGVGLWGWDFVTRQIWATEKARRIYGFSADEVIPLKMLTARLHPDDFDQVYQASQKCLFEGTDFQHDYRIVLPDGSIRWLRVLAKSFLSSAGAPERMTGVALDITERKRVEEALQESEARFRTVANTAPVLIWMSGADKLCNFFNQGWLDFTGRPLEAELGNGWAEGVHPDDLPKCLRTYTESFDARRPFTMEYRLRRHDGEYRWVSDHGVPRYDTERNFLGYIGSCVDLTERKRAEAEVQRGRIELAHATRVATMGTLGGSIAHELNQPLTAILSNAQAGSRFLGNPIPDFSEVRELLKDIAQDANRAGGVIRQLRTLVKKGELQLDALDLNHVIGDVVKLLHSDIVIRKVQIVLDFDSQLSPVRGDSVQLQQVMLNLLLNAFDAMKDVPESGRTVRVSTRQSDTDRVQIEVKDCGTGISPEKVTRLFEPFQSTKRDGLGLGLSICHSIVEAHGGRLWAANNTDRGATFYFTVPVAKDERIGKNRGSGRAVNEA